MDERRGQRLVEALVACGIFVALAGVVVPVIGMRRLEEGRGEGASPPPYVRAQKDIEHIAAEIRRFVRTKRRFPTGIDGATTFHFLYTDGEIPPGNPLDSGPSAPVTEFLADAPGSDPWGRAYLVNVNGFFSSRERVQVLSAGPDGVVETPPSARAARGDDLLAVVE